MSPLPFPTRITGHIELSDGSTTDFSIDPGYGWQQWGNDRDRLGETVDLLAALTSAAYEHLLEDLEDDES